MFGRIAGVYDVMNTAMTAGLHHRWRTRAVDRAGLGAGDTALDVCCGTGDLTLELARRVRPGGRVIGCDFSEPMLELARKKAAGIEWGPLPRDPAGQPDSGTGSPAPEIGFDWADALELPYEDRTFDAVAVGFGLRNLADTARGLEQMTRVLRPGGRLVILEITQPHRPPLSTFFSLWFDRLVPRLGALAGDADAYSYLPESVRRFPVPEALARLMAESGLGQIRYVLLAGGIIAIHSGVREA